MSWFSDLFFNPFSTPNIAKESQQKSEREEQEQKMKQGEYQDKYAERAEQKEPSPD